MIVSKLNYQEEIDFLVSNSERNKYICNLVDGLRGNSLVLFQLVEKHGNILYDMLQDKLDNSRRVFFVYGGTDADKRTVRSIIETEKDAVICASYGVYLPASILGICITLSLLLLLITHQKFTINRKRFAKVRLRSHRLTLRHRR